MADTFGRQQKIEMKCLLAKEEGWRCHYCWLPLVPCGQEEFYCTVGYHFDEHSGASTKTYTLPPGYSWPSLDHKVAQYFGVNHDKENLVLACIPCNSRKAHRYSYDEFYAMTAAFRAKGIR